MTYKILHPILQKITHSCNVFIYLKTMTYYILLHYYFKSCVGDMKGHSFVLKDQTGT